MDSIDYQIKMGEGRGEEETKKNYRIPDRRGTGNHLPGDKKNVTRRKHIHEKRKKETRNKRRRLAEDGSHDLRETESSIWKEREKSTAVR